MMTTREGFRSPKHGDRGVYFLCTGPDRNGPRPGPSLKVVIYGQDGKVVRTLEQREGECVQPGHVSFFGGPRDRSAVYRMPIVDVAPDGAVTELIADFQPHMPKAVLSEVFSRWVEKHGIPSV